ncbi:MAG TPA: hypothetical protein VNO18_07735 [Xanthobacteraceae bacterium]|nr:hypothetical protein [Xanthobacteraceae bacterium]
MEERALDRHDERQLGCAAIHGHGVSDVEIADDESASEDAQRLAPARNKENQTDTWILQNVEKGVDAAIARTIRDNHGRVVEDANEPRRVPFGGKVDRTMCVRGTDHDKRRAGDELATLSIKP